MELFQNPIRHREELTFSMEGVAEREQTLFKSFVRLLDHRTHQRWSWRAEGADLRVLGAAASTAQQAGNAAVLILGAGSSTDGHRLSLPIHADALERELNLIGSLLAARPSAPGLQDAAVLLEDRVHLARWPTTELLGSRDRIRLATLMTGRPMSLQQVEALSGVDHAACLAFVKALADAGILEHEPATESRPAPLVATTVPVQSGLLSRIRSRLGLGAH